MSIKELNSIYAFGYGLFIYSPGTFNEWMQEKKCQAKKMLSYFDMHKDMFLEMITKGIALPIYQIPTYQYSIYITTEKDVNIPEDWEQVYLYKDCGLLQSEQMINFAFLPLSFLKNTVI